MKNLIYGLLAIAALTGCDDVFNKNNAPQCNADIEDLKQTLSTWTKEAMLDEDEGAKLFDTKIVSLDNFYEYKSSPLLLGTSLYNDYQNSRLCEANADIEFTDSDNNKFTGELTVRYQILTTVPNDKGEYGINYRMSGADVQDLGENAVKKLIEALQKAAEQGNQQPSAATSAGADNQMNM